MKFTFWRTIGLLLLLSIVGFGLFLFVGLFGWLEFVVWFFGVVALIFIGLFVRAIKEDLEK